MCGLCVSFSLPCPGPSKDYDSVINNFGILDGCFAISICKGDPLHLPSENWRNSVRSGDVFSRFSVGRYYLVKLFLKLKATVVGTLRRVRYGVGFWQRRTAAGTRHGKESDPPEVVLKRTYELLGGGHKQYNVLLNNCEHFAYFCKTGRPWSDQAGATLNLFGKLTGHNRLFSKNINSNSKL